MATFQREVLKDNGGILTDLLVIYWNCMVLLSLMHYSPLFFLSFCMQVPDVDIDSIEFDYVVGSDEYDFDVRSDASSDL